MVGRGVAAEDPDIGDGSALATLGDALTPVTAEAEDGAEEGALVTAAGAAPVARLEGVGALALTTAVAPFEPTLAPADAIGPVGTFTPVEPVRVPDPVTPTEPPMPVEPRWRCRWSR